MSSVTAYRPSPPHHTGRAEKWKGNDNDNDDASAKSQLAEKQQMSSATATGRFKFDIDSVALREECHYPSGFYTKGTS